MCSKNKVDVSEGEKPKLIKNASSSLKKHLKEYYRSPKTRHRVLIVNRRNFFNDSESGNESKKKY